MTAYCRKRRLCVPHFYWWKKRVGEATATKFVEVRLPAPIAPGAAGDSRVEVRLGNGRSLLVGPGFDAEHVRALLAVMESRA